MRNTSRDALKFRPKIVLSAECRWEKMVLIMTPKTHTILLQIHGDFTVNSEQFDPILQCFMEFFFIGH